MVKQVSLSNHGSFIIDIKEKEGKSSETDSITSQISSKTSRGKKESTKDAIKDTTSDSQILIVPQVLA